MLAQPPKPQSVSVGSHTDVQVLFEQVLPAAQLCVFAVCPIDKSAPQPPQFWGSVVVLTQRPLHSTVPLAHWQVWFTQFKLLPQAAPVVQHGWLCAPHGAQVLPEQTSPRSHELPPQHGWLAPPQCTQVEPLHRLPAAHIDPVQHGCVVAPHAPQVPFMQARPPEQVELAQQGCPSLPHEQVPPTQMPVAHGVESGMLSSMH